MNGAISPPASHDSQAVERCRATPNCMGTILDGYCTVCGRVASRGASGTAAATGGTVGTGAASTAGTAGTGSVASGSTGPRSTGSSPSASTGWDISVSTPRPSMRGRFGGGLVDVPIMPAVDPTTAVMEVPVVPEDKRYCSGCNSEIGRARDGKPGRVKGFCSKCRLPFSFVPILSQGDLVADQYRVAGCLAYGGLGWIYLAEDERVSHRWVVLKGLLNAGDEGATQAALAERRFLARVEHPNVVRIYNFVEHDGHGYTVMEYVGGKTLKAVLRERRRAGQGPLPLDLAIAYVLAILPAFSYLHELRLVYNDFKPDNVMLQGGDVRLIDLGAVTRLEDPDPIIYGTEGYQAPEVATVGPSVPADLYSIARCLAVLVLEMPGYQTTHRHRLPSREQEPLFQRHESFYRFLLKATAQRLEDRYQTADEMEEALETILHEVTAVTRGTARPTISQIFGGDLQALHAGANGSALQPDWRHLPPVRVDPADPAAGFVLNAMVLDPPLQVAALREAIAQGTIETTAEAELGLARALIEVGQHAEAEMCLARVEQANRRDWRGSWYRGLSLLAQGRAHEAAMAFDLVYAELPGELAPKLGLALAAELMGDMGTADRLYDLVAATDHSFTSASFGLARARLAQGDRAGAGAAYQRIPPTSSLHTQAQVALARTLIGGPGQPAPVLDELAHASAVIERLPLTYGQRVELAAELLEAALALLESGAQAEAGGVLLLDHPFLENPVREALERAYRDLARLAVGPDKIRLVDRANQIRPLTAV